MSQSDIPVGNLIEKVFQWNDEMWRSFEAKSFLESPVGKALAHVNAQDLSKFYEHAAQNPGKMLELQMQWWENQLTICQNTLFKSLGHDTAPVIESHPGDKRFHHESWSDSAVHDFIRQSYLLFARHQVETVQSVEGLPKDIRQRLEFFFRQSVSAMAPSNFISTNPELLKLTLESKGENLVKGLQQFEEDLSRSAELLKIRMTSHNAFEIGKDIAHTPGKVVFRNDLIELIQYQPMTDTVLKTPTLIVPPFINKYYILDLRDKNSMVRWQVEQGHTVFLISWRNPDATMAQTGFEDYVRSGVLEALDAIEQITGEREVNGVGYCIGGTLLATTMAYFAARRMKPRFKTGTFFTTLLDFEHPGDLGVFLHDPLLTAQEAAINEKGYMDGRQLAVTFSLLRENSLYWNYYVDNYLRGNSPIDFDILYWNSDSTNIAANCANFLLRELYFNNKLKDPRGIKVGNNYIDLSKIEVPTYFLSTQDDHIALWEATFQGSQLLGGETTFVLGESGHVAGVVNHPSRNKYGFWTNADNSGTAEEWLNSASRTDGSWWPHWHQWVTRQSGGDEERIPARQPGSESHPPLEEAPGQYVKHVLPL